MSYETAAERRNRETLSLIESQVAENNELLQTQKPAKSRLTLAQKIFRISREAGAVERKGVAENNGSDKESRPLYAFTRIEDVLDVVQPLLNKYKLILTGNVPKEPITHVRQQWATSEVLVDWTLEDTETAESRTWRIPGCGSDSEGKGIYKSLTGSRKYACIMIFNLRCGDDAEVANGKSNETLA